MAKAKPDFVIVGSSGGGGTIAWLLAKAGFEVLILELGSDWSKPLKEGNLQYNPITHDEHLYRLARPELKRRPRGDYSTLRAGKDTYAIPVGTGWTASMLGGGSVIWGVWSFRPLPIDHRLGTHFEKTGQAAQLRQEKYSIVDWPVSYAEMAPYYDLAEALLAVCGNRDAIAASVLQRPWYQALKGHPHMQPEDEWRPRFPFPNRPFPITPVGYAVQEGMKNLHWSTAPLPSGMVVPGGGEYSTRNAIGAALDCWKKGDRPPFWQQPVDKIWSARTRDACNMCGFCGEFLCWGKNGPKSSSRVSTIRELQDLPNAEIRTNAKVFEVMYSEGSKRATGLRYLDISDPDRPRVHEQRAKHVIVSGGAVQSARLLLLSGPSEGLGNDHGQGQVGRNIMFHLFGLGSTYVLPGPDFQGMLHGELCHTGNTTSFELYFVKEQTQSGERWWKGGNVVSTAKKNPMENAVGKIERDKLVGMP